MNLDTLLQRLRDFDALRDNPDFLPTDRVQTMTVPGEPARYADDSSLESLDPWLRDAVERLGIKRLYEHQVRAIDLIRSGKNVVIESPTASGKTLSFNIPLAETLARHPRGHALMIHPMKALSNDQRRQLTNLFTAIGSTCGRELDSWTFDGDMTAEERRLIKTSPPAVIFTNPEMLHHSFLGWNEQWTKFLKNLKVIVIDEIHEYRGYFGSNLALLLRRFLAKLAELGAQPQIVMATATCANAREHAMELAGVPFELVQASGAMRPVRHYAFIEPAIPDYQYSDIYRLRLARATVALVTSGISAIVFCPARKFSEEAAFRAQKELTHFGLDPDSVTSYRSGYTPQERRGIEDRLRNGSLKVVFSTNALEIGIDIGRLDACILAGFPDSVLSAWQRIGRTGRSWERDAYVLFYALNNPFDRFYARNLETFLSRPLDEVSVSLDNPELVKRHLPFLLHEVGTGLNGAPGQVLGPQIRRAIAEATHGTRPVKHKPNYQQLDLRGSSGKVYRLMHNGTEIGTISDTHRFREAYIGAIYPHCGHSYRVAGYGATEVFLDDADPTIRTESISYTSTQVSEIQAGRSWAQAINAHYGKLVTYENISGYVEVHRHSGEVLREHALSDARPCSTRGFWLEIDKIESLGDLEGFDIVLGLEQLFGVGAPFLLPCDRHDIGTLTSNSKGAGRAVYVYETVPGGIGLAEKVLDKWHDILNTAVEIVERCSCDEGCPSCLPPSRRPGGAKAPAKYKTVAAARLLMAMTAGAPDEIYDPDTHAWRKAE